MWYIYSSTTKSIDQESKPLEETIKIDGMEDFPPDLQGLIDRFLRVLLGKLQLKIENVTKIAIKDDMDKGMPRDPIGVDGILITIKEGEKYSYCGIRCKMRDLYNLTKENIEKLEIEPLVQNQSPSLTKVLNAFYVLSLNISDEKITLNSNVISRGKFLFDIDPKFKNRQNIIDKIDLLVSLLRKILPIYSIDLVKSEFVLVSIEIDSIYIFAAQNNDKDYFITGGNHKDFFTKIRCETKRLGSITKQNIKNFTAENRPCEVGILLINDNAVTLVEHELQGEPFYIRIDIGDPEILISPPQTRQLVKLINLFLPKLDIDPDTRTERDLDIEIILFSKKKSRIIIKYDDRCLWIDFELSEILKSLEMETLEITMDDFNEQIDDSFLVLPPKETIYRGFCHSSGSLILSGKKIFFLANVWPVKDWVIQIDMSNDYLKNLFAKNPTEQRRRISSFIESLVKTIKIDPILVNIQNTIEILSKNSDQQISIFCNREQWNQITPENSNNIKIHGEIKSRMHLIIEKDCIHMMPYDIKFPVSLHYWYISPENIWPTGIKPTYEVWQSQIMLIHRLLLSIIQQFNIKLSDLHNIHIHENIIQFFMKNDIQMRIMLLFKLNSLTEDMVNQLIVDPNVAKNWQQKSKYVEDRYFESSVLILKDNRVQLLSSVLQTQPFLVFLGLFGQQDQRVYYDTIISRETTISFITKLINESSLDIENIKYIHISDNSIGICCKIKNRDIYMVYNVEDFSKLTKENIEKQWKIPPKPRAPLFMYRINLQVIDDTITLQYS